MSPFAAPRPSRRWALLAFGMLNAVLAGIFALMLGADLEPVTGLSGPARADAPPQATARTAAAHALRQATNVEDLAETVRRPLFRPDRRPPGAEPDVKPAVRNEAETKPAAAPAPPPRSEIRLVGIVTLDGRRKAVVRVGGEATGRIVGDGAAIEGWRITHLDADTVTLSAGSHRLMLKLAGSSAR